MSARVDVYIQTLGPPVGGAVASSGVSVGSFSSNTVLLFASCFVRVRIFHVHTTVQRTNLQERGQKIYPLGRILLVGSFKPDRLSTITSLDLAIAHVKRRERAPTRPRPGESAVGVLDDRNVPMSDTSGDRS